MSKRDPRLFLTDMLESIEKIDRYTDGLSFDQFEANDEISTMMPLALTISQPCKGGDNGGPKGAFRGIRGPSGALKSSGGS